MSFHSVYRAASCQLVERTVLRFDAAQAGVPASLAYLEDLQHLHSVQLVSRWKTEITLAELGRLEDPKVMDVYLPSTAQGKSYHSTVTFQHRVQLIIQQVYGHKTLLVYFSQVKVG